MNKHANSPPPPSDSARKLARLREVLALTGELITEYDTHALLARIVALGARAVDAERATLFLFDAKGDLLVSETAIGVHKHGISIPSTTGIAGRVFTSQRPAIVNDAYSDADFAARVDEETGFRTESVLCVPLMDRPGSCIGVLQALNKRSGTFAEDDTATLTALAVHVVLALVNAKRFQDIEGQTRLAQAEARRLRSEIGGRFVGVAHVSANIRKLIEELALSSATVVITGEQGVGKSLVARLIHYAGAHSEQAFVSLNCAALTADVLAYELFGDDSDTHPGRFHQSSRGTLFLDEINALDLVAQARLLAMLSGEASVERPARLIVATRQDLVSEVVGGHFLEELYQLLNVVNIRIPPLRDRREDLPHLIDHLLTRIADESNQSTTVSAKCRDYLIAYDWPGNVRELERELRRLCTLASRTGVAEPCHLSAHVLANTPPTVGGFPTDQRSLREALEVFEREFIARVLERRRGRRKQSAAELGISVESLRRKLKIYGLQETGRQPVKRGQ